MVKPLRNLDARELQAELERRKRLLPEIEARREKILTELREIEALLEELSSSDPIGRPREGVRRLVRWFDRSTDELVDSAPLHGIELQKLRRLFDLPDDDPMYDCYPITIAQALQLQAYMEPPIQLDRYDYFVEADAVESRNGRNP